MDGQCKIDFETWYSKDRNRLQLNSVEYSGDGLGFYDMSDSMQFGVKVDFYRFVGLEVFIMNWKGKWNENIYELKGDNAITAGLYEGKEGKKGCKTYELAREKVLIKANDIYNQSAYNAIFLKVMVKLLKDEIL